MRQARIRSVQARATQHCWRCAEGSRFGLGMGRRRASALAAGRRRIAAFMIRLAATVFLDARQQSVRRAPAARQWGGAASPVRPCRAAPASVAGSNQASPRSARASLPKSVFRPLQPPQPTIASFSVTAAKWVRSWTRPESRPKAPSRAASICCGVQSRSVRSRSCLGATKARRSRRWCRGALPAPAQVELDLQSFMSRQVDDRPSKACPRDLRAIVDLQCRARPIEKESRTDASLWVGRRSPGTRWRSGCARHPPRGDPQGSSPSASANGPAISAEYDVPTDDACLIRATTMETIHEAHADR